MRHLRRAALAALLLLPASGSAQIVKYRTADGQVGFAQDLSGVPAGAEVITTGAQGKAIEISPAATAAPPADDPAARKLYRRGRRDALEAAGRTAERRQQREAEIRGAISQTQGQLDQAIADRKKACHKRGRTPRNREMCNQAREAQRQAEERLEMIRHRLEEDFEDVEDYFPPEEEEAFGDDEDDGDF